MSIRAEKHEIELPDPVAYPQRPQRLPRATRFVFTTVSEFGNERGAGSGYRGKDSAAHARFLQSSGERRIGS